MHLTASSTVVVLWEPRASRNASSGIHLGWNFKEGSIYGAAVSGTSPRTHFAKELINRAQALTGGAFGPEASIVWLRSSKPVCDPGRFLDRLCASTPVWVS
jgi:hypothetical protein